MQLVVKHLVLGAVLSVSMPLVHADNTWVIKTPKWELSKEQYQSILKLKGTDPTQITSIDQKNQILQDLYIRESLTHQALDQGLDKDPQVQQQLEELRRDFLARSALEKKIAKDQPDFTARAKELYQANLATQYSFPIRYKLQMIQVNKTDEAAKKNLEQVRTDVAKNTLTFEQAIEKYSEATDKSLTKDGQWYKAEQLPKVVVDKISTLDAKNNISDILADDKALYLVKWQDKRDAETIPFEKIKGELEQNLKSQYTLAQQQVILEDLRKQFKQDAKINLEP